LSKELMREKRSLKKSFMMLRKIMEWEHLWDQLRGKLNLKLIMLEEKSSLFNCSI
jgi:hypothetical protein